MRQSRLTRGVPTSGSPRTGRAWQAGELSTGTELTVNGIAESNQVTRYAAHQVITYLWKRGVLGVRTGTAVWFCPGRKPCST
jgi:hypothetical protein